MNPFNVRSITAKTKMALRIKRQKLNTMNVFNTDNNKMFLIHQINILE